MMNPAVLSHFAHGGINPWKAGPAFSKRLGHFFSLIALAPVDLATYSVAFDAREIVDLFWELVKLQSLQIMTTCDAAQ